MKTPYPVLSEDISSEVVIVGGGLAGVTCAYLLTQAGKKVVLLEQGTLGSGATGGTTAFITQHIDDGPDDLVKMLGQNGARLVWQSGGAAIDEIERIIRREDIDCDFERCFAYVFAKNSRELAGLSAEHKAARQLGLSIELTHGGLPFKNAGYLVIPNQAKFNAGKFLQAVAAKASANGARIFEHTSAVTLSREGEVLVGTKNGHTIRAKEVIVATHWPFNNPRPTHYKKGLYRSYVLELRLPPDAIKDGVYWDQSNPYTYFRVDQDGRAARMLLGGADHRADLPIDPRKNFQFLKNYAAELLQGKHYSVIGEWKGPIIESSDGLPLIGAYAPNRYIATAFSGNGMTYSVVAAMLFRDLLLGTKNRWTELYDPTRKLKISRVSRKAGGYIGRFFGGYVKNLFISIK